MIPKLSALKGQISAETSQEKYTSWILDKLGLDGLSHWTEQQQIANDLLCK